MKRYLVVCIALAMLLGSAGIVSASAGFQTELVKSDICIVNGLSTNDVQQMDIRCWDPYIINFNKPVISFMAAPKCGELEFDAKDVRKVYVMVNGLDDRKRCIDFDVELQQYKVKDDSIVVKCNFKELTPLDNCKYNLDVTIIVMTNCGMYIFTDGCHDIPVIVRQNVPV